MRDYCPTKGKYTIPRAAWNRVIWLIRDYDRLKQEADQLIMVRDKAPGDMAPAGRGGRSDPVAVAAIKRERFLKDIAVMDDAMELIPQEYRKGIWRSLQGGTYPKDADRCTYSRWKSRYIYAVAEKMGYI